MSQLIGSIAGAPQAANTAGGYYQGAANDIYSAYGPSATSYFTALQNNALRPQFNQQAQQLAGTEAAQGVTHSGAGINAFGNLGAQQAGTLSQADAGLFSQGLQGATNVYEQMPAAQNNAYNDAIQQFYQALSGAGQAAAGIPPNFGSGPSASDSTGAPNGYQGSSGGYYTQSGDPYLP